MCRFCLSNLSDAEKEKKIVKGKKAAVSRVSRAKGVPRAKTERITYAQYKKTVIQDCKMTGDVYRIQSKNHLVSTVRQRRLLWSRFDDKRFYLCPIHSVPYGDFRIRAYVMSNTYFMCL